MKATARIASRWVFGESNLIGKRQRSKENFLLNERSVDSISESERIRSVKIVENMLLVVVHCTNTMYTPRVHSISQ